MSHKGIASAVNRALAGPGKDCRHYHRASGATASRMIEAHRRLGPCSARVSAQETLKPLGRPAGPRKSQLPPWLSAGHRAILIAPQMKVLLRQGSQRPILRRQWKIPE